MSIHKLTAGSGYDYLTRQVAAMDATDKGHVGLASYYTEKGETPGVWVGSGMAGVDGLDAGDVVTAEQMQALFGAGHHPLAAERAAVLDRRIGRPDLTSPTAADYAAATRLGAPYKVYDHDVSGFRIEVAKRLEAVNEAAGLPRDWPVPAAQRAQIRTAVARDFFVAEHGREPADARELAAVIAKHSRARTTAVAGYDLTFSPVKSVSTLWAVADQHTAATIERAHQAAIKDALGFLEQRALFTRLGTNGVRQVDVQGLVATAFTHRDSRAGDPDLHTHVAVANKVQTLDGKWRAVDGRVLFKATVAASETYNTALERHLVDALGVRFAERPGPDQPTDRRKRPVREIVGVDPGLNQRFSKRRVSVNARRAVLAAQFQASHGRPPTPVETLQLAQQATLETRDAKHEPRSLAEQRVAWRTEAVDALGGGQSGAQRLRSMLRGVLHPTDSHPADRVDQRAVKRAVQRGSAVDPQWLAGAADRVVSAMEGGRATWQFWHVYAEAQRQVRAAMGSGQVPGDGVSTVVDLLVAEVLNARSVSLARPTGQPHDTTATTISGPIEPVEPPELRRVDGASVYTVAGADLFTSAKVIGAERGLVAAAGRRDGQTVAASCVDLALLESTANGVTLNPGQVTLVREMATSGARVQLAIAPAGSGKTTAMRTLAAAWTQGGGTVLGLAPSAAAADALGHAMNQPMASPTATGSDTRTGTRTGTGTGTRTRTGTRTDTLAKLTYSLATGERPDWMTAIGPSTLVVIDEAGMADTLSLDTAVSYALEQGASVRLIGDDQQLAAIGAGGVLRDIRAEHGALALSELIRFTDPAEGAASLALRDGRPEALGFYLDHQRVHVGDVATITEDVFSAWQADRANGLDSVMLAPTRDMVAELNQQARAHRLDTSQNQDHPGSPDSPGAGGGPVLGPGVDPRVGRAVEPEVRLGDGNQASVGDLIITRANDRSLRTSLTDWVKNGDRWHLLQVHPGGDLTVQHAQHGRTVRLPTAYVQASVDLGYACTVHTAQGVTADTVHGLAMGAESRQQLYTMLTRGRLENHVYLQVVGDGDPHSVITPDMVHPRTAVDVLSSVLARDDAQRSATSLLRDQASPAIRLGEATARYLDSLYVAAEHFCRTHVHTAGPDGGQVNVVDALDTTADLVVPGLCDEAAWPTLRAHLLLLGAHGEDPVETLRVAAGARELDSADDRAAVIDWRLDSSGLRNAGTGPLPWVPSTPQQLAQDPQWGEYLTRRAELVSDCAALVRQDAHQAAAAGASPVWALNGIRPNERTLADVEVWRAAMQVPVNDRRPTGAPQLQKAAGTWQRRLNRRVIGDLTPALKEWSQLLHQVAPQVRSDELTPMLAERLATMSRAGITAHQLVRGATAAGPLPDDHAAAALWWRMARHLTPAVAARITGQIGGHDQVTTQWTQQLTGRLVELLGPDRADRIQTSTWWPALLANIDHALARGWRLDDLLHHNGPADTTRARRPGDAAGAGHLDECLTLVWRTSIILDPIPDDAGDEHPVEEHEPDDELPPEDLQDGYQPPSDAVEVLVKMVVDAGDVDDASKPSSSRQLVDDDSHGMVTADLTLAELIRDTGRNAGTVLDPTDADVRRMYQRAQEWEQCPVTRERMLEINQATLSFFESRLPRSWAQHHLLQRLGMDLAGDDRFRPGYAPAGWTTLVDHLRLRGVTDQEMLVTGVAATARTGRLIDRFRDRVIFPIPHPDRADEILGFVGRRHPDLTDVDPTDSSQRDSTRTGWTGWAGPKYLNTPDTPLFHKGAQLFGSHIFTLVTGTAPDPPDGNRHGGPQPTPVIVEGPMDAVAVTLATAGRFIGTAPLGTALTDEQASQLAILRHRTGHDPVVATDADLAGQLAAERDFWLLTPHGLDPSLAQLPAGFDPADLLARRGPAALAAALVTAHPLGDHLFLERLDHLDAQHATQAALQVLAARPGRAWETRLNALAAYLKTPAHQLRRVFLAEVKGWDRDPRRAAGAQLQRSSDVRSRLVAAAAKPPRERWAALATEVDPRLPAQPDWLLTADLLQEAHDNGHDIPSTVRALVTEAPLGDRPARDLRYRLVTRLDMPIHTPPAPSAPQTPPQTGSPSSAPRDEAPTSQPRDRAPQR